MPKRQRGVAVITALLLTTLAISIVASLFWQQQVQVRSMENQRLQLQTKWILRGALDWAGLVLRQDAVDNKFTALDQVWATPLAETRLDQYIERERVQGENFDATLSGGMVDATSRYNLNNLASGGQPDPVQVEIFKRLLSNLQLNPSLAVKAAQFVAAGQAPVQQQAGGSGALPAGGGNPAGGGSPAGGGAPAAEADSGDGGTGDGGTGGQPAGATAGATGQAQRASTTMKLVQLEDLLAVPGFTPAMVDKLRPVAIVLPGTTKVNVNTAPAAVLAALLPNYSVTQANSLVEQRKRAPWNDVAMFGAQVQAPNAGDVADVHSDWFLVQSHIKLDRATLNVEALISRTGQSLFRTPQVQWVRQI
jgi:general secretion pathway protein K